MSRLLVRSTTKRGRCVEKSWALNKSETTFTRVLSKGFIVPQLYLKCNTKSLLKTLIGSVFPCSSFNICIKTSWQKHTLHFVLWAVLHGSGGQHVGLHEVQISVTANCIFMMELNKVCHTSPSQEQQLPSLTSLTSEDGRDPRC